MSHLNLSFSLGCNSHIYIVLLLNFYMLFWVSSIPSKLSLAFWVTFRVGLESFVPLWTPYFWPARTEFFTFLFWPLLAEKLLLSPITNIALCFLPFYSILVVELVSLNVSFRVSSIYLLYYTLQILSFYCLI